MFQLLFYPICNNLFAGIVLIPIFAIVDLINTKNLHIMKKYLNKKQAESMFKEIYASILKTNDRPMKSESWHNYTDGLCKDGQISERQYNTWSTPKFI